MRREAENLGSTGNGGVLPEILKPASIEVRFVDLKTDRDIKAITSIFGQSSVIEHLAGIAPVKTSRNIGRFRQRLPELMHGISVDPNEIIIATETEIGNYFKSKDPSKAKILVAESAGPNPKILGTIMVEKPGGGITTVSIAKLAVSENARGKGVGSALIKAATAIALSKVENGGWGYKGASAGIIQVSGSEKPLRLFQGNKYVVQETRPNSCISWDNDSSLFVHRDVLLVYLNGENYKSDPSLLPKTA